MPGIPSFKGLTAVVTGASSGMGRELAVLLAREGCHLALCDVSMGALEETKAIIVSRSDVLVTVHNCDVASTESIVAFRAAVEAAHPNGWHLLFNNEGSRGLGLSWTCRKQCLIKSSTYRSWGSSSARGNFYRAL